MKTERPGIDYRILNFLLACAGGAAAVWIAITMPNHGASPHGPELTVSAVPDRPLTVYVRGAVGKPGVYRVAPDSRLYEVLKAAGGPKPDADTASLNLARRLHDEEMLVVPVRGSTPPPVTADSTTVNLNSASVEQLEAVPGMSATTAKRIVAWRERYGPFRRVEELAEVPGLKRRYKALAAHLRV